MRFIKILAFGLMIFTSKSFAASPDLKVFKAYLESRGSVEDVLFPLAFHDESTETLQTLRNGMTQTRFPHLSIQGQEITVNGKMSGVAVKSVAPLSLSYKGLTWTYADSESVEQNYFRLLKTLKISSNISSWFLNAAYAADGDAGDRVVMAGASVSWKRCFDPAVASGMFTGPVGPVLGVIVCGIRQPFQKNSKAHVTCDKDNHAFFSWKEGERGDREAIYDNYCPGKTKVAETKVDDAVARVTSLAVQYKQNPPGEVPAVR